MKGTLRVFPTPEGVIFRILGTSATAELSWIKRSEFIKMAKPMPIHEVKGYLFFNRIIVQPKERRKRYGTILMLGLIDFCDKLNISVVNGVNAYGEMTQEEIYCWIERYGFINVVGNIFVREPRSESHTKH